MTLIAASCAAVPVAGYWWCVAICASHAASF
jgi:hypothetical protein